MTTRTDELAERLRSSLGALVRAGRNRDDAMPEHRAQTLGFLMRDGALTTAELAARRRVRHQSMQSTVADLEADGLVERGPDPRDQRARLVSLTRTGLTTLEGELARRRSVLGEAIDTALDDDERALLARVPAIFEKLAGHVGERR